MAIDAFGEQVMKLAEAGRQCPGGAVSSPTVYRWCKRGIAGVRLESIHVGGVMMTSRQALQRFFERVTEARRVQEQAELDARSGEVERSRATQRRLESAGLL